LYKFHATAAQVNSQFSPADSQSLTTAVVKHFHLLIRNRKRQLSFFPSDTGWRIAPARLPRGADWERLARRMLLPVLLLALWRYASAAGLFDPSFVSR